MERALDRLQRAVAGWVGPVVYALPILEVWLLTRMDDRGATVFLVVLQVAWGAALALMLVVMLMRVRMTQTPQDEPAPPSRASSPRPLPRRRGDH